MSASPPSSPPGGHAGTTRFRMTTVDGEEVTVEYNEVDDDDMDFEPASEVPTTDGESDYMDEDTDADGNTEAEEEGEFLDAVESLGANTSLTLAELLSGELGSEGDDDENAGEDAEGEEEEEAEGSRTPQATQPAATTATRPLTITRNEILELLSQTTRFRSFWRQTRTRHQTGIPEDEDGEEEDDEDVFGRHRRRKRTRDPNRFPKVPSDVGRSLMESGRFGTNERLVNSYVRKNKLAAKIMTRELGLDSPGRQRASSRLATQDLIPSSQADTIVHYDHRCYSGQFSDDGNFFFSCSQDFRVRMYDTSNPYKWRYYRTVVYPYGQWTITDASLSPDNKHLAYSSIRSIVCLANTDPEQGGEPYLLDFSDTGRRHANTWGYGSFGIWSLRFSGDGREIVAGTSDYSVYVYDIETRQSILRIHGHENDVNAVCYGDKSSPHLLYSGSDDTTLKVWDRRSLGDQRAAGVFLGHTEGLTYVDSKGDGRYVLSNGKDQTMKLWDLRKMMGTEQASKINSMSYSTGFDYRFQTYDESDYNPHPHDCSLVTFRGHKVLKTLIRCHFSPPGSTDSRYVYTGSEDGSVYVYNLDATLAGRIDVQQATQNTRPKDDFEPDVLYYDERRGSNHWKTCVRDASWHPHAPMVAATSWNGYGMSQGTCTVHSWNDGLDDDEGDPKMGLRLDHQLRENAKFYENTESLGRRVLRSRFR